VAIDPMIEFSSESRPSRSYVPLYTIAILALGIGGLFLYIQHQKRSKAIEGQLGPVPGMLRAGDPGFEYYKKYIRLSDVKATLGINFAKSRIAIVSGIINNEGDRKLEALEMHLALFDVYQKLSAERTRTPLRPGVGMNRPMEPLEKRDFTVWIEPIEQLWNPKELVVEITGLKYQ
jgi:hypothetical protein